MAEGLLFSGCMDLKKDVSGCCRFSEQGIRRSGIVPAQKAEAGQAFSV